MERSIVEKLLVFLDKRDPSILIVNGRCELEELVVIADSLLNWLKLERKREIWIEQGRKTRLKSLELELKYPWCKKLVEYTKTEPCFAEIFTVEDGKLNFRGDITDEYKKRIRMEAYEKYNPQMVIG